MEEPVSLEQQIAEAVDPRTIVDRLLSQCLAALPLSDGAAMLLVDGDELTCLAGLGTLGGSAGEKVPRSSSLAGLALDRGTPLSCSDSETDERVDQAACRAHGSTSLCALPLGDPGAAVAALVVTSDRTGAFSDDELDALRRLAPFSGALVAGAVAIASATTDLLALARDRAGELAATTSTRRRAPGAVDLSEDPTVRFLADVIVPGATRLQAARRRIEQVLSGHEFRIVFQPVFDLTTGQVVGAEALSRFGGDLPRTPDLWFAEAHAVGLGLELEFAALEDALATIERLPDGADLVVNAGPEVIGSPRFLRLLGHSDTRRIVVELTEHTKVADYRRLRRKLLRLRGLGVRVAVDDTGAGFASFSHILQLNPDVIKLAQELTAGIQFDPVRQALARSLVDFADVTGARIVAEGIETDGDLAVLCEIGIRFGQGFLLGRPAEIELMASSLPELSSGQAHRSVRANRRR